MKRKALFVGINTYNDWQIADLSFAIADAADLYAKFKDRLGFSSRLLCDHDTTRENVLKEFNAFIGDLVPGDVFFFYFAGHGFTQVGGGGQLLVARDDVFNVINRGFPGGISYDYLADQVQRRGCHSVFVLDACRTDILAHIKGVACPARDLIPKERLIGKQECGGSMVAMRSCSTRQFSQEIPALRHGLYTAALLEVIQRSFDRGESIFFNAGLSDAVASKMSDFAEKYGIMGRQIPEFVKSGIDLPCVWRPSGQLGNSVRLTMPQDEWTVLDYDGVYDGRRHGIELLGKLPDEVSISYSSDGGRTWAQKNILFVDAGTYSVRFRIEAKGREPIDGERSVTIEPRHLQRRMLCSQRVSKKADGELMPVLKLCDTEPCRLTDADWAIVGTERRESALNVTVEGRRNYCGRLTLSIPIRPPIEGGGAVTAELRNLCDQYRVMLKDSAEFHADPEQGRPDLAEKFIGWQGELYGISGGAKKRATIRVAELDKLISAVIAEFRAFRREFDTVPFFIEHRRQKVELIAKKLLHDSVAEIFYKSVTIQMEDE